MHGNVFLKRLFVLFRCFVDVCLNSLVGYYKRLSDLHQTTSKNRILGKKYFLKVFDLGISMMLGMKFISFLVGKELKKP